MMAQEFDLISFVGGLATAASMAYVLMSGDEKQKKQKKQKQQSSAKHSTAAETSSHDPKIKEELTTRVKSFFGEEKFNKLEGCFVVVVGLGGVGSHAANMLVRSGIRRIRLVDFDQVTLSSLNRHAVANLGDVGISKAEAIRRHFKNIVPWCEVEAVTEMFRGDNAGELLAGSPDYVLDCIDDVKTKAELLAHCTRENIKVLTSMGAGGKSDPTRLRIGTLADCVKDPLASKIRWSLKKLDVSPDSVLTVYSVEKPVVTLLPLSEEQKGSPEEFGAVEHIRLRVLPVLGTSPAIFGQAMASFVLTSLAGMPYSPEPGDRLSKNVKHRVRQKLNATEKRLYGSCDGLDLDEDDLEFIIQQTWGSRCAVSGGRMGGGALNVLTRWDPALPSTPYNLVFVQPKYEAAIEASPTGGRGVDSFDAATKQRIEERLMWCRDMCAEFWPPTPLLSDYVDTNRKADGFRTAHAAAAASAGVVGCTGSDDSITMSKARLKQAVSVVSVVVLVMLNRSIVFPRR
jgi:tRNA A37 threonylcarbamoyladenosine dehydratase